MFSSGTAVVVSCRSHAGGRGWSLLPQSSSHMFSSSDKRLRVLGEAVVWTVGLRRQRAGPCLFATSSSPALEAASSPCLKVRPALEIIMQNYASECMQPIFPHHLTITHQTHAAAPGLPGSSVVGGGSTVSIASTTMHYVSGPSHSLSPTHCHCYPNCCDSKWEGPLTWHTAAPAIFIYHIFIPPFFL